MLNVHNASDRWDPFRMHCEQLPRNSSMALAGVDTIHVHIRPAYACNAYKLFLKPKKKTNNDSFSSSSNEKYFGEKKKKKKTHTHQHGSDETNVQTGIFECIGHSKNACANIAFQQMNHRVQIRCWMLKCSMQRWIVQFQRFF